MAKWVFDQWDNVMEYPTLGIIAEPGDILDALMAPDARWSLNADQGAVETVYRYAVGGDPNYIEPTDGHVLTYSATENTYVPTAPESVGLPSVDAHVADKIDNPLSATSIALSATIAAEVDPVRGETIRPSQFAGATDRDKLQATIAACIADGYKTIVLDRWYDLTGAAAVSIDKVNWYDRDKVVITADGGGIIKNDSGFVFTSATANTGDVALVGVKFKSTPGVGATVFDADKLLRFDTHKCEFRDWDHYLQQTTVGRWAQSVRLMDCVIVGGSGAFVRCRESYDMTLRDNLVEDRDAKGEQAMFFENTDGTMTGIANRNLRILSNTVENCDRVPIKLAMCWSAALDLNYFEQNGNATDPQIDLWTLATLVRQTGLRITNNMVQQKTTQKDNKIGAILMGASIADPVFSSGNVTEGTLYQFGSTSGRVVGTGDRVESGGRLIYSGQENQYLTLGAKTTTTAGRPKNPTLGDPYLDTDLGKLIAAKTAGTKALVSFRLTAGATTSGNITLTILGTPYVVAVTAGDTLTQVRDKIVAAATTFYPTWKPRASSTNVAAFDALVPGLVSGTNSFNAGGTGVTSDYFGLDGAGTSPTYAEHAVSLSATATLDFPSIPAAGQQELTITVTGAAVGESVALAPPAALEAGLQVTGYVSAANTVKVRLSNVTAAAIDPASATWRATVLR